MTQVKTPFIAGKLKQQFQHDFFDDRGQILSKIGNAADKLPEFVGSMATKLGVPVEAAKEMAAQRQEFFTGAKQLAMNVLQNQKGMRFNEQTLKAIQDLVPTEHDSSIQAQAKFKALTSSAYQIC